MDQFDVIRGLTNELTARLVTERWIIEQTKVINEEIIDN